MSLTGGHTGGLSPNVVKTALDDVLFTASGMFETPDELDVRDSLFFRQGSIDRDAFIWEEWSGVGHFEKHVEQEEIKRTSVNTGNKTTVEVNKFIKSVPVSAEMNEDDIHGTVSELVRDIGDSVRRTRTSVAVLETYGDAFDGNFYNAPDGVSLANNSHTTLNGDTLDNLETGALTPDNLEVVVRSLRNQIGHDGERAGHGFDGILVPVANYFNILEIMDSEKVANSAENNINVFMTKYGQVQVKASGYLDSAYNSGANAGTGYHAISRNHGIMRKVRVDVSTDFIEPRYSSTDSWEYRARYREVAFPGRSGIGSVHSTGA